MAGYKCKIVIENTHPPVWRRVLVPDKITFREMHEVIQILFGWEGVHSHVFQMTQGGRITIGTDESWGVDYNEEDTLVDSFFRNYKSMRYTYDFGDDWKHKIIIEEMDTDYTDREAVLLKFKGDNFEEDFGGVWGAECEERRPYDRLRVEEQLKQMKLPRHEELQEIPLLKEMMEKFASMCREMLAKHGEVLQSRLAAEADAANGECSAMEEKVQDWEAYKHEESWSSLRFSLSNKTQQMLLMDLGNREATDYFKYLRIPSDSFMSHDGQVKAISDTLRKHPEYLCYIFDEKEYKMLAGWVKQLRNKGTLQQPVTRSLVSKVLAMGLADFVRQEDKAELCFAADIESFIGVLDEKAKAKTYKALHDFNGRMGKILQLYGMIDMESLYDIYHTQYDVRLEKENFLRYIYWHCHFNDFLDIVYQMNGTRYAVMKDMDAMNILGNMEQYAKELSYVVYSKHEIEAKGADLAERSEWVEMLYNIFHYQLQKSTSEAQEWLFQLVLSICSGYTLNKMVPLVEKEIHDLEVATDFWAILSGLMLDLELPMLKGRSRLQYAEEQKCSAWSIGMVDETADNVSLKEIKMYQFPVEIQEWMLDAQHYGMEHSIKKLFDYKEKYHVCSEEYLYLLADSCITIGQTKEAESLMKILKKSSPRGKRAVNRLEKRISERYDVFDDEENWTDDYGWFDAPQVSQPYVRSEPKIGRNDPCPCGSGKKYKKCCGR